ncbi:hypothetical protein MBBA_1953 [Methanoculleus bourgensis]|nr:hypothetical protein MBBA_1953 [Methanoculleus bourgensis]
MRGAFGVFTVAPWELRLPAVFRFLLQLSPRIWGIASF